MVLQHARWAGLLALAFGAGVAAGGEPAGGGESLVGGPLAGGKLPPFPTQHGERPGHPGCLPGQYDSDLVAPEVALYPGAVEHWRAYMFKYMPIRSFFDRQSQLQNWVAPQLPGADSQPVESYAAPLYFVPRHEPPVDTGRKCRPVPVVRCRVGTPVIKLDLGELDVGLYAVRVIGAVETAQLRPFRRPLFLAANVNDGPDGGMTAHRLRLGYCDEFYSVAEVYFHAPEKRRYRMELAIDRGSEVDLLVHNITLDDVLAGTARRVLKTRTTVARRPIPAPAPPAKPRSREERLTRDATLWEALPPINRQLAGFSAFGGDERTLHRCVELGADTRSAEAIEAESGRWERPGRLDDPATRGLLLVNRKLQLRYTLADLQHQRPLPDPYPWKDDGAGLYFPHPQDPNVGRAWWPIADEVQARIREFPSLIHARTEEYARTGSPEAAHDAALALARWAYAFPTFEFGNALASVVHDPGPYGRDYRCRRRETVAFFLPHYMTYVNPTMFDYDRLFAFIQGNQLLADSVGRYVPWVKRPEDVLRLIDTYLVQITAKRILRYHYHTDPMDIANLAAVVGDTAVTDPWMEWLFSRTFIYPLPVAGIQDAMITGTTREGTEIVGSTYYAQGEGAARVAEALDLYRAAGGNPQYDLSDPARYPKPAAHNDWRLATVVAGSDFLRIGDVGGPDKTPGFTLRDLEYARSGWRWTRDPKFAFLLQHFLDIQDLDAAERAAVAGAAGQLTRAPWLDNRSRVLPMWAGILEAGLEHDDPRFRRAAYLRVGYGTGHQHDDPLDLQVVAHGLPMTIDGGQRPGYSTPGDRATRVHNTVEVDGHSHADHSWVTALADTAGAQYLAATGVPPAGARLYRRQIALIDGAEGQGSTRLSIAQQRPGATLPKGVVTPQAYVFDVFRVAGGTQHAYCFHGPLHDDFQWNATGVASPAADSADAQALTSFSRRPELSLAGDAPRDFQATWRYTLAVDGPGAGEQEMLGANYDPQAPRKFTRLHLLGLDQARALRGQAVCRQWGYDFTNVMVARRAATAPLATVFAAIIEPFASEPFLTAVRRLDVNPLAADAGEAAAVLVKTKAGSTDLCFAAARPDQACAIPEVAVTAAGEFAFYATDGHGLRQATLVGGTRLDTPHVRLQPAQAERRARVVAADYGKRQLQLDQPWPAGIAPTAFEIGQLPTDHVTTYTALSAEPRGAGTLLTLNAGADYYRSEVLAVHPDGTVTCALKPLVEYISGNRRGWVASNDAASRFWRADYLGNQTFQLRGGPVDQDAFAPHGVLRLWEYGAGDDVRHSTTVSLRRTDSGHFALAFDVDVTLSLPASGLEISPDGRHWESAPVRRADRWCLLALPAARGPRLFVRAETAQP